MVQLHVGSGPIHAAQVASGLEGLSIPDAFGALILKAAAHKADARDRGRHLTDAAVLLACVDPFEERTSSGSDRSRLLHLRSSYPGVCADVQAPALEVHISAQARQPRKARRTRWRCWAPSRRACSRSSRPHRTP